MKVTFTKKAEEKLDEVVNYLETEHSKKHADKFLWRGQNRYRK